MTTQGAAAIAAVLMTALTYLQGPILLTELEIEKSRYANRTYEIADDSTHHINFTSLPHLHQPVPKLLFNNNVPSDDNIKVVYAFTHGWMFHCLSMASGLIHGSTESFDKIFSKMLLRLENRIFIEHRKLHEKFEELKEEFQKTKKEKGAPILHEKSHRYNVFQKQDPSQWTLFDSNTESVNSIESLLARFLVWLLMTAEVIICLYRQFRKKSSSEDNKGPRQLEELKELQQLRREIQLLRSEFSERVSSIEKTNPSNSFSTPPPNSDPVTPSSSSKPRASKDNNDVLADFRAKLAQETAQKRRAQQEHYNSQLEIQKRKHEEEMKEREDRFKTVIGEKLRMDREEFLQWATNPD